MTTALTFPLLLKNADENGYFSGYASIFNVVDRHHDIVAKGAFHKSLALMKEKSTLPKMLWQHESSKPIGIWHDLFEDDHGLFVKGQLILDIQAAQEAYALLRAGVVDSLSIGFRLVKAHKDPTTKARILDEIELHEISLVTFAANQQARITNVKDVEGAQTLDRLQTLAAQLRLS